VNVAIHNASEILILQQEHGSFKNWLYKNHPIELDDWVKLLKKHSNLQVKKSLMHPSPVQDI
jgi:DNA-3-methyladenine glycosylase I